MHGGHLRRERCVPLRSCGHTRMGCRCDHACSGAGAAADPARPKSVAVQRASWIRLPFPPDSQVRPVRAWHTWSDWTLPTEGIVQCMVREALGSAAPPVLFERRRRDTILGCQHAHVGRPGNPQHHGGHCMQETEHSTDRGRKEQVSLPPAHLGNEETDE